MLAILRWRDHQSVIMKGISGWLLPRRFGSQGTRPKREEASKVQDWWWCWDQWGRKRQFLHPILSINHYEELSDRLPPPRCGSQGTRSKKKRGEQSPRLMMVLRLMKGKKANAYILYYLSEGAENLSSHRKHYANLFWIFACMQRALS